MAGTADPDGVRTGCCIAGGGPAGVMLGFLLARAGIDVVVLEKHVDFFRDFRGDTIHPSTLQVMDELGLLDALLRIRHSLIRQLTGRIGASTVTLADFAHVPGRCKYIALMPQWDFLNFLAMQGRRCPTFRLEMGWEATDLIHDGDRVSGVRVQTAEGPRTVQADLVIAADGRSSVLRERAGLTIIDLGAPIDVLWMRLSRKADDPGQTFGNVAGGVIFVTINRDDYYQCALVIKKGGFDGIRDRGLPTLRQQIVSLVPYLADRVGELQQWDDIKLLTVRVDRLSTWYRAGFLCIGDAAHAMSPIGGVGINLAIQDAVAAANLLVEPLRRGSVSTVELEAVQRRRELPTRLIQALQVLVQRRVLEQVLNTSVITSAPWFVRVLAGIPWLRRLPARVVGVGFRPEHIHTPAARRPEARGEELGARRQS
jgi:2-polyprenyl-6-methoxyphenol hydroxylase-like FAD-dependent oxidoreductase